MMNIIYAFCILSSQSGRRRHRVTAMRSDDLLVGLKPAALISSVCISNCMIMYYIRSTGAVRARNHENPLGRHCW
jgi:hypothetical protein